MTEHLCHAEACKVKVPPRMLMCRPHWHLVPAELADAVWVAYVPGQEDRKDPTDEYLKAARAAIEHVAAVEGRRQCPHEPDFLTPLTCSLCLAANRPKPKLDIGRVFPARHTGRCGLCRGEIDPPEPIRSYDGQWIHEECTP